VLKYFEVSGFKNFAKPFSIDFSDVRDYKFNEHCIKDGLLKNGIIYGENSTGKTNFGLALFDIVAHLTGNNVSPGLYDNYINAGSGRGEAEFRYLFQFDDKEISYVYIKESNNTLSSECLKLCGDTILAVEYSGLPKDMRVNIIDNEIFSRNLNFSFCTGGSALKFALNNTALGEGHPLHKMMLFVSRMLWFRSLGESRYIGYKTNADDYLSFIAGNTSVLSEFQEIFSSVGIKGEPVVQLDTDGKKRLYTKLPSPICGPDFIPFFATASSGTKALYDFFYWYKTAPEVSLMFIDEFDAFYHFELSETIVNLLSKLPNTQVVLTSHNTNLLTNNILRPDCLFVLTHEKLTSFTNATHRELREGHNLERLYMSGEFNG
jgi:hypothetical protein